jgi:phosphatidylinositol alpha-1,6-mannosyltransferase
VAGWGGLVSPTLLATNDFPPKVGGIQSYLWELWRRLDPADIAVLTARSHRDCEEFDREQAAAGRRISRVRRSILYFPTPFARRAVRTATAHHGAGLVLLDPVWPLGRLGPSLGVPYGVILHGAEFTIPARIPFVRRQVARILQKAAIVVCAGPYQAKEARRLAGADIRVIDVPPGVDCDRFRPLGTEERAVARRRLGLPEDAVVVASVSRLVPRKGMDVLIEAVRELAPGHPGLVVAIAGSGRDATRLHRIATRLDAPVHFLGRIEEDEKAVLLGSADLFAMICRNRWAGLEHEGFGIVFLEAAAAGLPQVAGQSGGAADAVVHGETGFVVDQPRDRAAVIAALRPLLEDPALRRSMGVAARARAQAYFDHDQLARRLAAALAEVGG